MEGEIQRPETLTSPVTETSASMEMIMSKSKPITPGAAIFYGGLIAGILDAADRVVAYYFAAGFHRGNVGHDLRRCGIHCYELCRTTAHSRCCRSRAGVLSGHGCRRWGTEPIAF